MDNFRYRKARTRLEIGELVEYRAAKSYSFNRFTNQLFEQEEDYVKFHEYFAQHRNANPNKPKTGEMMILLERIKLKTGQSFYLVYGTNIGYYFVANSEVVTK